MRSSDLKYLIAYIIPISGFVAVLLGGGYSYLTVIIAFVCIPLLEFFVERSQLNMSLDEEMDVSSVGYFDWLLYLNVPLIYGLLGCFLYRITTGVPSSTELIGMVLSVGIVFGASGINVAHELGHKPGKLEQILAKVLLLPSLYMHFFIEHNRGHHVHIATPEDPASSRKGEIVYLFWVRSVVGAYINAWKLEAQRLSREGQPVVSLRNEMLVFQLIQILYLGVVYLLAGGFAAAMAVAIAVVGFLLLETINYIEHYGLQRQKLASGRYERVDVTHSWNSNHEVGRIILYELTRHSDHHYKANRKYQVLRHHDESPQLPLGYPGSMLLSFVPPLWFAVMDKRLKSIQTAV